RYAVVRVLPALVREPPRRLARVLDEAVAVLVAVLIDPRERTLDVRPEPPEMLEVAGLLEIAGREHDEERRRVDRTVVQAERNLLAHGHLAAAHLVHDLAGLGVAIRIEHVGLLRRKHVEDAPRSEEHTSELQSRENLVCRLLLEKKKK